MNRPTPGALFLHTERMQTASWNMRRRQQVWPSPFKFPGYSETRGLQQDVVFAMNCQNVQQPINIKEENYKMIYLYSPGLPLICDA